MWALDLTLGVPVPHYVVQIQSNDNTSCLVFNNIYTINGYPMHWRIDLPNGYSRKIILFVEPMRVEPNVKCGWLSLYSSQMLPCDFSSFFSLNNCSQLSPPLLFSVRLHFTLVAIGVCFSQHTVLIIQHNSTNLIQVKNEKIKNSSPYFTLWTK